MAQARSTILNGKVEGIYHCISRCVRRAFLCGNDSYSGKDYEHRKQWTYLRLKELAGIFLVDVCGYAIMDNHLHVILRNRPDRSGACSDEEIALRWWRLFPKRRTAQATPEDPTREELDTILAGEGRVEVLRDRLCSLSWFMRCLKEHIARLANEEDKCTGRFWEGRFKCIALLDQAAVLTCSAYVDLNPVRAAEADKPEASSYTSAEDRVTAREARNKRKEIEASGNSDRPIKPPETLAQDLVRDQWLCPLRDEGNRRGFLNMDLETYLELLDWTGREIVAGKEGVIPAHLAPILTRLEINHKRWLQGCQEFDSWFYRVAGTVSNMFRAAIDAGQNWFNCNPEGKGVFLTG